MKTDPTIKRFFRWTLWLIALLFLGTATMLIYQQYVWSRAVSQTFSIIDDLSDIKYTTIELHLTLEEMLNGEIPQDKKQLDKDMKALTNKISALHHTYRQGFWYNEADYTFYKQWYKLKSDTAQLKQVTAERLSSIQKSKKEMDHFHLQFQTVHTHIDQFTQTLQRRVADEWREETIWTWGFIVAGLLIFLIASSMVCWIRRHSLIITKQRDDMAEQLRLTSTVFDTANEGIAITNNNNTIIAVNKAYETLTGYTRAEVVGKNPNVLSSGKQPKEFYIKMWGILQEKGSWSGEVVNKRKDGSLFTEWLSLVLVKDKHGEIQNHIAVFSDISVRKAMEDAIAHRATYDELTELPNRYLFMDRLRTLILNADRNNQSIALLFIDLDHFKAVNDQYGHAAGDWVLQEAARRIKKAIRASDTAARLGGDEFCVILENIASQAAVEKIADNILRGMASPFEQGDQHYALSASIGIASYPACGNDIDTLIANADSAMYQSKKAGKNQRTNAKNCCE